MRPRGKKAELREGERAGPLINSFFLSSSFFRPLSFFSSLPPFLPPKPLTDIGPLGIITWGMGVEPNTPPPPQTGAKPSLAGGDRAWKEEPESVATTKRGFSKQPAPVTFLRTQAPRAPLQPRGPRP